VFCYTELPRSSPNLSTCSTAVHQTQHFCEIKVWVHDVTSGVSGSKSVLKSYKKQRASWTPLYGHSQPQKPPGTPGPLKITIANLFSTVPPHPLQHNHPWRQTRDCKKVLQQAKKTLTLWTVLEQVWNCRSTRSSWQSPADCPCDEEEGYVTNLSLKNNLPMFQLNAPVIIMVKVKKCEQTLQCIANSTTCHWKSKVSKHYPFLPASSSSRGRLSVTNLSLENNFLTFWLNVPVLIPTKMSCDPAGESC